MKNLIKAVKSEITKRYTITPDDLITKSDDICPRAYRLLNRAYNTKPYTGTPEQIEAKIRANIDKKVKSMIADKMDKIDRVNSAPDRLNNTIIIKIDWTKSRTWGYTAKAADNFGNVSDVASGCGYDKASTALAGVLNKHDTILKKMYQAKDKQVKKDNRDALGYGSGYGVLPYFEGGVGVNCHVEILRGLGYNVTSGNDVIVISDK